MNLGHPPDYRGPNFYNEEEWKEYLEERNLNNGLDEDEARAESEDFEKWKRYIPQLIKTSPWMGRDDVRFSDHYFIDDKFIENFRPTEVWRESYGDRKVAYLVFS